jgi:hypothetical protein
VPLRHFSDSFDADAVKISGYGVCGIPEIQSRKSSICCSDDNGAPV